MLVAGTTLSLVTPICAQASDVNIEEMSSYSRSTSSSNKQRQFNSNTFSNEQAKLDKKIDDLGTDLNNYEAGSLKGEVGAERKCSFNAKGSQWVHEKIKSIDHDRRVMINVPIDGAKLPLDYDNTQAFYTVRENPDGSSTAGYEMQFRTKPAFMGILAKGGFKKQLGGTLVGLKHFVETGEKVNLANERYEEIKDKYPRATVLD